MGGECDLLSVARGWLKSCGSLIPKPPYDQKPHSGTTCFKLNHLNCLSSTFQLDWTFLEGRYCILTFCCVPQESSAQR